MTIMSKAHHREIKARASVVRWVEAWYRVLRPNCQSVRRWEGTNLIRGLGSPNHDPDFPKAFLSVAESSWAPTPPNGFSGPFRCSPGEVGTSADPVKWLWSIDAPRADHAAKVQRDGLASLIAIGPVEGESRCALVQFSGTTFGRMQHCCIRHTAVPFSLTLVLVGLLLLPKPAVFFFLRCMHCEAFIEILA